MVDHDLRTLDAIVEAYKQDQRRIRGLRETTLQSYEGVIRPFLRTTLGEDPLDLTRLMPPDVVKFVTSLQDRYAASSITQTSTALRSLFRFLRMTRILRREAGAVGSHCRALGAGQLAPLPRRATAQAGAGGLRSEYPMRAAGSGHGVVPIDAGTTPPRARRVAP